ncbi:IQ calmodulin-binding motif family protein [Leishmania donovani]|uniref:IQ calmodulin-binding motif family protein n=1 Tax=Leishmania donovani TaxID=5661 RepID=A0A504XBN7_LEIDO|nr:IQ calmodulin-binding motif family protein [Leishmania donovani]
MDATHDRPPAGSAAVSVHAAFGSFSQARELTMAREQPLLALKAYSTWMRRRRVGASARAAALLDFTLYCNMFALQIWETEDVRPDAPLALARDYFQLVMDEFSALYKVVLPDLDAPETDADLASMPILDAKTDSVPGGLWAALLLTIGNQACVELRAGGDGVAKAERLFLLSRQLEGQMSDVPSLGWTWRIVRDLNAAVCAVMHCDFSQGEEAARSALALLETHIEDESADALSNYDRAIALASEGDTGSSLAALMSRARNRLAVYVEERQAKATLQAEEAAGAANAEKKDVLQGYLEKEGLTTTLVRVGALKDLYEVLARSLPGYEDCEALPQSLFAGTRFEAGAHESIFAVLFCTDTPLQWTLRLLDAAGNPVALRHSVWAPRPVLASLLMEMAAQRPPAPRSTAALQTRKEISDGNGKLRQQVIQMFAPPAAAPTVKQKAHEWVDAAVELLGQRLSLLLKTERAFEEQWIATERIRSALHTFAVPQDILRVKQELLKEKHLQERRQDRSARLIVHFFRHIVKQRTLGAEQTLVRRHRFEERVAAAVTLQKYIRRWCAYQEMGRRLAARKEYVEKIIRLQSLARRRAAARAYAELRESRRKEDLIKTHLILFSCAALQIQRMYRGHCARLRCYHLRGQMHAATLHHMRDSRNYYATVIQKCVRGMLARCQYGRAVYASRCYGRNAYKTQLWERSCVVIQRAYRACRSRRRLAGYRAAPQICGGPQLSGPSTAFSRHFVRVHTDGAVTADKKQAVAANRIQKMYRSCAAKRRLEALKYARRKELEAREEQPQWGARSTFSLKDCVF